MSPHADTIAAIATPIGRGGIGIIRMSGPRSVEIARSIFRSKRPLESLQTHRLYLGHICDPHSGATVDEVLLSHMKGPHSYTGEDVVEINSHSGYFLLSKILSILMDQGARLAEPGEFTMRAFLSGRMDLAQAEAVVDLINSQSERGIQLAAEQLKGAFTREIEHLRQAALEILALAEVWIDFPEEETGQSEETLSARLRKEILGPIRVLTKAHEASRIWIDGVKTVLMGRVNVGKSSLLNRLLEEERAIVTAVPGTTRDVIEANLNLGGLPIRLTDTAGFREAVEEVERAGISLTEKRLEGSDLLLWVVDGSRAPTPEDHDIRLRVQGKRTLVVLNKIDLGQGFSMETERTWGLPFVKVSALTGEGIDALRDAMKDMILGSDLDLTASHVAPNLRHKTALQTAAGCFEEADRSVREGRPMEIVAMELHSGLDALGEIIGKTAGEDLLHNIFSRFCLGK